MKGWLLLSEFQIQSISLNLVQQLIKYNANNQLCKVNEKLKLGIQNSHSIFCGISITSSRSSVNTQIRSIFNEMLIYEIQIEWNVLQLRKLSSFRWVLSESLQIDNDIFVSIQSKLQWMCIMREFSDVSATSINAVLFSVVRLTVSATMGRVGIH